MTIKSTDKILNYLKESGWTKSKNKNLWILNNEEYLLDIHKNNSIYLGNNKVLLFKIYEELYQQYFHKNVKILFLNFYEINNILTFNEINEEILSTLIKKKLFYKKEWIDVSYIEPDKITQIL